MNLEEAEIIISNIKSKCVTTGSENQLSLETIETLVPLVAKGRDQLIPSQTTLFKLLANACGRHEITPNNIFKCDQILINTFNLIETYIHQNDSETRLCIEWGLKFIGNLAGKVEEAKNKIYPMLIKILPQLIGLNDHNIQGYALFACYNCLTNETIEELMSKTDIINAIINCLIENDNEIMEWGLFIVEKLLKQNQFLEKIYLSMNPKAKLFILDNMLEEETHGEPLNPVQIEFLSQQLESNLQKIQHFSTSDPTDMETLVIHRELEVICTASAHQEHSSIATELLLRITIATLHQVHQLSKSGDPDFEIINKVEKKMQTEEIEKSPLYGFKRDLIRLLGNLCSLNSSLKTLAGRLDALQLVCDCSQIDERNPFIQQWCIFAVQALTHNHQENKAILAGFTKTGPYKESKLLKDIKLPPRI